MGASINIAGMRQDVLKILEEIGSQNRVVCDTCEFDRVSTCANLCLGSEQVSNLNYREIRA